ncbi:DUF551 domain-containing protein [Klebsiella aerogenes]
MTKSTITREQVIALIAEHSYDSALVDALEHLLAAMDSEPVAWTSEEAIAEVYCDETGMIGPKYMVGDVPLYRHAQLAPVFPKATPSLKAMMQALDAFYAEEEVPERGMLSAFRILLDDTCRAAMLQGGTLTNEDTKQAGNSPVIPDGYVMVPKEPTTEILDEFDSIIDYGAEDSVDAWHRLLAAAPHDTHAMSSVQSVVTVSDTWIPVSERMPENKPGSYEYLVFETLNNRVNHDYWNVPDAGDEAFTPFWNHYGEYVTHWMPLPAATQEVK